VGGCCAPFFWGGELGPHLTQCGMGRGLPLYPVSSSSIKPFGYNRHGPKIAGMGAVPLFGGGELGPHLTQCRLGRGLTPTVLPSGILIHRAILPPQTWAAVYMDTGFWKVGGCCAPFHGGAKSYLTQCGLSRSLPPYKVAS